MQTINLGTASIMLTMPITLLLLHILELVWENTSMIGNKLGLLDDGEQGT